MSRTRSLPSPLIFTPAIDLPADSTDNVTGSGPAEVMIWAMDRPWFFANDHSLYVIEPGVLLIAADVPSLPLAPSPTPPLKILPAPFSHAPSEAAVRYCWKLSVVPDSSLRKITTIGCAGSVTPGFSAAISGASQLVTAPLKILATVGPSNANASTPGAL